LPALAGQDLLMTRDGNLPVLQRRRLLDQFLFERLQLVVVRRLGVGFLRRGFRCVYAGLGARGGSFRAFRRAVGRFTRRRLAARALVTRALGSGMLGDGRLDDRQHVFAHVPSAWYRAQSARAGLLSYEKAMLFVQPRARMSRTNASRDR